MNKINIYARVGNENGDCGECLYTSQYFSSDGSFTGFKGASSTGNDPVVKSDESLSSMLYQRTDHAIGSAIASLKTFLTPTENDWQIRADRQLTQWNGKMNAWFATQASFKPVSDLQAKIESLGNEIKEKFAPLTEFNNWLDTKHPDESWHMQLATYLVKLPLRSARNIIQLLYSIIETILYTAVHPLNSTIDIAKMIVQMLHSMMQPETWTKIGIGVIGMHIGQILIFATPLSPIALGIGAAMMIAGLSIGALRAAMLAELDKETVQEAVQNNLFKQLSELPECFLTSFFMGMIMGGIQKATTPRCSTIEEAREFADKYVRKHKLPAYRDVRLHANGKVVIDWSGTDYYEWNSWNPGPRNHDVNWFRARFPKLFKNQGYRSAHTYGDQFKIVFPSHSGGYAIAGASSNKPLTIFQRIRARIIGHHNWISRKHVFQSGITPLKNVRGL